MGNKPFYELVLQLCNLLFWIVDRRQSMWSEDTHAEFHRRTAKILGLAQKVEETLYPDEAVRDE